MSLVMSVSFVGKWGAGADPVLVPDLLCPSLCGLERAAEGMVCLLMHGVLVQPGEAGPGPRKALCSLALS